MDLPIQRLCIVFLVVVCGLYSWKVAAAQDFSKHVVRARRRSQDDTSMQREDKDYHKEMLKERISRWTGRTDPTRFNIREHHFSRIDQLPVEMLREMLAPAYYRQYRQSLQHNGRTQVRAPAYTVARHVLHLLRENETKTGCEMAGSMNFQSPDDASMVSSRLLRARLFLSGNFLPNNCSKHLEMRLVVCSPGKSGRNYLLTNTAEELFIRRTQLQLPMKKNYQKGKDWYFIMITGGLRTLFLKPGDFISVLITSKHFKLYENREPYLAIRVRDAEDYSVD